MDNVDGMDGMDGGHEVHQASLARQDAYRTAVWGMLSCRRPSRAD